MRLSPAQHRAIVDSYCQRIPAFVQYRMDPRLFGRISAREVVEELTHCLTEKATSHRCSQTASLLKCLRSATTTRLEQIHQDYLAMYRTFRDPYLLRLLTAMPSATAAELAQIVLGAVAKPRRPFDGSKMETTDLMVLQRVFNALPYSDREILAMRHFERLSRAEIAVLLELAADDASQRYLLALGRLKREFFSLNCLRDIPLLSYAHAG